MISSALFLFTRVMTVLAALGAIGRCLVIPYTARFILRVAFQKDTETELAETARTLRSLVA